MVTRVHTKWVNGNLEFRDESDNTIFTIDGVNDKVTFASGKVIDLSAATGMLSLAAGEIALADMASDSVDENKIVSTTVGDGLTGGSGTTISVSSAAGANVGTVADDNTEGGIPVLHRIDTAGGATANTDVTLDHKTRVLDVWVLNRGAGTASDTITVTDGTTAITDAIDISGADKTIARAGTIDDAVHEIAAAGTLRVTETDGGSSDSPAVSVYVLCVRVA